jgi:ribosome biogenesis protein UTP30
MAESISRNQIHKAVDALRKYHTEKSSDLLEADTDLLVEITLKQIPKSKPSTPKFVPLKHSIFKEKSDNNESKINAKVCLIVKDPQSEAKLLLAAKGTKVDKVIGISKLKKKYATYEARRMLSKSFDRFLADDRIIPMLPKALGRSFFKSRR